MRRYIQSFYWLDGVLRSLMTKFKIILNIKSDYDHPKSVSWRDERGWENQRGSLNRETVIRGREMQSVITTTTFKMGPISSQYLK